MSRQFPTIIGLLLILSAPAANVKPQTPDAFQPFRLSVTTQSAAAAEEQLPVPTAAQASDHFDALAATDAYLATVPPDKRARSDAYFEGGYWLVLWNFLASAAAYLLVLAAGWSARMRNLAERITRFKPLQTSLYWAREGGKPIGTLAVLHGQPFVFSTDDLDFIKSVAGLLGRALEIENLKYKLEVAHESLALSTAVVQDSALENAISGLPNSRFLDVWLRSHMHQARRQNQIMTLAMWEGVEGNPSVKALRKVAQGLRGDDLLVELAPGRYLLLLPHTHQEGSEIPLNRLRADLGNPPMGATLWLPERDDLMMRAALRRVDQARQEAAREAGEGQVKWKLATLVTLDDPPGVD